MATYEMLWDCASCGETKLLGKSHRCCPRCGAPQDPDGRYFPSVAERVLVRDHVYVGADLECGHCQAANARTAAHCVRCGAVIGDGDDSEVARVGSVLAQEATGVPAAGTQQGFGGGDRGGRHPDGDGGKGRASAGGRARGGGRKRRSPMALFAPVTRRLRRWRAAPLRGLGHRVFSAVVATLVLGTALGLVSYFWTRPISVELTGHRWSRSIAIVEFSAESGGDWCSSMPGDAYNVSRSTRYRTEQVADGEDCASVNVDQGDGTYRTEQECTTRYRDVEVADDWCDYTADRWVNRGSVTAEGRSPVPSPYWPSTGVTGCASLGCTREGGRSEEYLTLYREVDGPDDVLDCDLPQSEWARLEAGSRWRGRLRVIPGWLVCDSLESVGQTP